MAYFGKFPYFCIPSKIKGLLKLWGKYDKANKNSKGNANGQSEVTNHDFLLQRFLLNYQQLPKLTKAKPFNMRDVPVRPSTSLKTGVIQTRQILIKR